LGIGADFWIRKRWGRLLRRTESLHELEISVYRMSSLTGADTQPEIAPDGFSKNPISSAHPASLVMLSHLTLRVHMDHEYRYTVVDPYTRVCDNKLLLLIDLTLDSGECILKADTLIGTTSHGWEHLPIVLVAPGSFPRLRKVSVRVQATMDGYSGYASEDLDPHKREARNRAVEGGLADVQRLAGEMADFVFPQTEFRSLVEVEVVIPCTWATNSLANAENSTHSHFGQAEVVCACPFS
ncbi:hypothetical protein FA13DRAFT_1743397, partial [Coprinellus micaceus]